MCWTRQWIGLFQLRISALVAQIRGGSLLEHVVDPICVDRPRIDPDHTDIVIKTGASHRTGKGHQTGIPCRACDVFRIEDLTSVANVVQDHTAALFLHFNVKQPA